MKMADSRWWVRRVNGVISTTYGVIISFEDAKETDFKRAIYPLDFIFIFLTLLEILRETQG